MKEKLALLERVPEAAINRAACTLLDVRETWENSTKEERKEIVLQMSNNILVIAKEYKKYEYCTLKVRSPSWN